jgi:predicted Zn-dependent protease
VGKLDGEELEAAAARVARGLRQPVEVRANVATPKGAEDTERGQYRAATLLQLLRSAVLHVDPGKLVGSDDPEAKAPPRPDAFIFVTDVDLFTAKSDGVFAALVSGKKTAVVSVRRLREAFYRRRADPTKQRNRLVREVLRMAGRLQGVPECTDPSCVLAPSKMILDLDTKGETFCRACAQRVFEGKLRI